MIKKRWIFVLTALIAVVALSVAYLIFVYFPSQDVTEDKNGRELIFEQVSRDRIYTLEVSNEYGTYTVRNNGSGSLYIEEHPKVYIDSQALSNLVVYAGTTYTMLHVADNVTDEMWKYGLDEASSPSSYTLTTTGGSVYKVLIGDLAPTRTGYYVTLEGSNTVHIYNKTYADVLLAPVESLVSGLLTIPGDMTYYYLASNFTVFKDNELVVQANYLNEDERSELDATTVHRIVAPVKMGASTEYDRVLQTFVEFVADEVVEVGLSEEVFAEYGFDNPKYLLYYTGGYVDDNQNVSQYTNMLSISEKTEDGYYYVASPMFDIVGKVPEGKLDFLEWDLLNWINKQIFAVAISNVATVEFSGGANSELFRLSHSDKTTTVKTASGEIVNTSDFKQLYLGMLYLNVEGYTGLSDEEIEKVIENEDTHITDITVISNSGGKLEYSFYRYSDMRALVVIKENGEVNTNGEFYVPVSSVKKLVSDVARLQNGESVDSSARY